jgi:hypothetical protein
MKNNFSRVFVLGLLLLTPALVHAQFAAGKDNDIQGVLTGAISFIGGTLVQLVFAIALIVFIWGLFQSFIIGGADEEKRKEGKSLMVWGIVALAVMVSVWGIVNVLTGSFKFTGNERVTAPVINVAP